MSYEIDKGKLKSIFLILAQILVNSRKWNYAIHTEESVESKTNVTSIDKNEMSVHRGDREVYDPFYTKSLDIKNQEEIEKSFFNMFNAKNTQENNEKFRSKRKSLVNSICQSELDDKINQSRYVLLVFKLHVNEKILIEVLIYFKYIMTTKEF